MKENQKVSVKASAPYHAGRVGYFQFLTGTDTAVLSAEPNGTSGMQTLFAVKRGDVVE